MGAFESGQQFLAGVLAKLPEGSRAQVEAALTAAEARDAVTLLGDGALARADYSRQMDEIRRQSEDLQRQQQEALDLYTRNQSWWEANEAEYTRLRSGQHPAPAAQPVQPAAPPAVDPRELVEQAVSARERDVAAFMAYTNTLALKHYQQFGEVLALDELLADPRLGKPLQGQPGRVVSLPDVYHAKYGEQLAAKAKEAEDARINKLVEDRFAERLKATASQPFPLRTEASPLDALLTPDAPKLKDEDYLDRAMARYAELAGSRS